MKYVLESSSYKPDYSVVAVADNCSTDPSSSGPIVNMHFDFFSNNWQHQLAVSDHTCLSSGKDILAYCQRVYPKLDVVNILKINRTVRLTLRACPDGADDLAAQCDQKSFDVLGRLYKCLHGKFDLSSKLFVPANCEYRHFFSDQECQTDESWRKLMASSCGRSKSYIFDYNLLQWCDAFSGGLSSFYGIEFVCCNKTISSNEAPKRQKQAAGLTTYPNEDDNIDDSLEDDEANGSGSGELLPTRSPSPISVNKVNALI
jgi:hypothetical protein